MPLHHHRTLPDACLGFPTCTLFLPSAGPLLPSGANRQTSLPSDQLTNVQTFQCLGKSLIMFHKLGLCHKCFSGVCLFHSQNHPLSTINYHSFAIKGNGGS